MSGANEFLISGSVSGLLYPGVTRTLELSVSNPFTNPITVTALGVSARDANPNCTAAANLAIRSWSGPFFTVPARATVTNVASLPITMLNLPRSQDACAPPNPHSFLLVFTGLARVCNVSIISTKTNLVSSLNPSVVCRPVTFSATVKPAVTLPATPTGTITFKDGAQMLGSPQHLGHNLSAAITVSSLALGTRWITASYSGDTNYKPSTSVVLEQLVKAADRGDDDDACQPCHHSNGTDVTGGPTTGAAVSSSNVGDVPAFRNVAALDDCDGGMALLP